MEHFGAEIGQLRSLAIRDHRDGTRLRHQPRVRRQHAVHVGPDDDFLRIHCRADNRRRVVRAAASQRHQLPFGGCPDEAGHDRHDSFFQERPQARLRFFARPFHLRFGAAVERVGDNQFRGIHRLAGNFQLLHGRSYQRCGKPLPEAGDGVQCAWRELPQQCGTIAQPSPFGESFVQDAPDGRAVLFLVLKQQSCQRGFVLRIQGTENGGGDHRISRLRGSRRFDQPVGHAAHGGNHHDTGVFLGGAGHNLRGARDARCIAHRSPAKFHNLQPWFHLVPNGCADTRSILMRDIRRP